MTEQQKRLVKTTVPILKEYGVLLTTHFYNRMFAHNPELKNIFNMGNQQNKRQQTALATAVLAYAEYIDNPSALMPVVDSIGHKHTSLDIRPEHYAIVGKHLIASIEEVLGDAATPELLDAWTTAYQQLTQIMSGHEHTIYDQKTNQKGGWSGWRPFLVKQKIKESSEITSFYLYPADGGAVADFQPGQYISVRLFLPELNLLQPRQYSISCAPNGKYYRISVKKETHPAHPDGMISNRLHNHIAEGAVINVSAPAGTFVLDRQSNNPKVFISGGVGVTPLISMLESLIASQNETVAPITWIQGCRNEAVHAFKNRLEEIAQKHQGLKQHLFYNETTVPDKNQYKGSVELDILKEEILLDNADYYLCGPGPFITKQYQFLVANGIAKSNIHFEEFGPASLQLN
ncbi:MULTISPECIES: NO-inducible flavohemoprotein [Chitinophagaceae]